MIRRYTTGWVTWLLPLLALRLLLPAGFMPVAGDAGLSLALCRGLVQATQADPGTASPSPSGAGFEAGVCPFGFAPPVAPLPVHVSPARAAAPSFPPPSASHAAPGRVLVWREQSPRAPPVAL